MPPGERQYGQSEIDQLIGCRKVVSSPPAREMKQEGGHRRNDLRLKSEEGGAEFRVFLRQATGFPENFSIGLVFLPGDGSGDLHLLRCNGPHGDYNRSFDPGHSHFECHVHRASAEALAVGRRAESEASRTEAYARFEEAVLYFGQAVNVADWLQHFPAYAQIPLPYDESESGRILDV